MFAGASAGGILSLSLAAGLTPTESSQMWEETVPKIFTEPFFHKITSLDNALSAIYKPDPLEAELRKHVGSKTLAELEKKIFIPTFKVDGHPSNPTKQHWAPEFFHNFPHSKNAATPIVDVALSTSAAPTFFPIHKGYIDGGCVANHPTMAAISEVLHAGMGIKMEDIVVLSISTGRVNELISPETYKSGDWGLVQWAPRIVDLLLDANSLAVDYECRHFLFRNYQRIDPILEKNFGLDDASAIPDLKKLSEAFDLSQTFEWIEQIWKPSLEMASPLEKPEEKESGSAGTLPPPPPDQSGSSCLIQ